MDTIVRRKLEMAARVREFCRAHASTEPGYAPILARLEDRLTKATAIAAREQEGRVAARGARNHRRELRRVLHFQLVRYLVAVGSVAAKDRAELAERFKLPSGNATNVAFLASVRALLASAEPQKDLLIQAGMKDTLLDDLDRMASEMETAIETVRTGRREHIGARADLESITAELVDQVKVLDGMTRYRFGDNPDMMAEWKAVKAIPGQPRNVVSPPPAGDGVVPPSSGGVAPAA
jgi:hypothetical protein